MPRPPHEPGRGPPHEPPHGPGHGPPHGGPPGGQFLVNDERRRNLEQIGEFLESVGSELKDTGTLEMGGQTIQPTATPFFVARYERMPGGELKLHFEIEWNPRQATGTPQDVPADVVSEKTSAQPEQSQEGSDAVDDKTSE